MTQTPNQVFSCLSFLCPEGGTSLSEAFRTSILLLQEQTDAEVLKAFQIPKEGNHKTFSPFGGFRLHFWLLSQLEGVQKDTVCQP